MARRTPLTPAPAVRPAYVLGGNRIPFARAGGPYAHASNQDMLTAALDGLVARYGLQGERIGEVAAGAVLKHSRDFNLTRESVLGSALSAETPAYDVQMACATGLETVVSLSNKIRLGQLESAIAGGVDTTSDAPIAVSDRLRRAAARPVARPRRRRRSSPPWPRSGPRTSPRPHPGPSEPRTHLSMGEHQALTTAQWGITQAAQDEVALASHQRLAAAYDDGLLRRPGHPVPRPDARREPARGLLAGEARVAQADVRARAGHPGDDDRGQLDAAVRRRVDRAARVRRLGRRARPRRRSRRWSTPRPRRSTSCTASTGCSWLPSFAVPRLLARNGLTLDDFDLIEIHEAFASTVLTILAAWESEEFGRDAARASTARSAPSTASRLNVHGSSLAAGHPFAATGGRIVATVSKELHRRGARARRGARVRLRGRRARPDRDPRGGLMS